MVWPTYADTWGTSHVDGSKRPYPCDEVAQPPIKLGELQKRASSEVNIHQVPREPGQSCASPLPSPLSQANILSPHAEGVLPSVQVGLQPFRRGFLWFFHAFQELHLD